ncbi:MAG: hypothetical protein ACI8R9_001516 [Paraglaciecola sp.]|jgi:hypothetical protein
MVPISNTILSMRFVFFFVILPEDCPYLVCFLNRGRAATTELTPQKSRRVALPHLALQLYIYSCELCLYVSDNKASYFHSFVQQYLIAVTASPEDNESHCLLWKFS